MMANEDLLHSGEIRLKVPVVPRDWFAAGVVLGLMCLRFDLGAYDPIVLVLSSTY